MTKDLLGCVSREAMASRIIGGTVAIPAELHHALVAEVKALRAKLADRLTWRPMKELPTLLNVDTRILLCTPSPVVEVVAVWSRVEDGCAWADRAGTLLDLAEFTGWIPVPQGGDDDGH